MEKISFKLSTAIGYFAAYKLFVFALAWVSLAIVGHYWPTGIQDFFFQFVQWDSRMMVRVAKEGYLAFEPSIQIFPVYPVLIRAMHFIIPNWELAAVAIAQLVSFFSFYYFFRLCELYLKTQETVTALVLFAFFPTAYFLSAPYMEPVFCATTFAAIYYSAKRKYFYSAIASYLSPLSRITGLVLAPSFAIDAWNSRDFRKLIPAAASSLGFFTYLLMNRYLFGDWFYHSMILEKHWNIHRSYPFSGAINAIAYFSKRTADQRISIIVFEIAFTLLAVAVVIPLWRKRRWFDLAYVTATLGIILPLDFWLSRPRYVLPVYPMFIVAAPWFTKKPLRLVFYTMISGSLFALYWALYLKGEWAF